MKALELFSKMFFALWSIEDLGTKKSTSEIHDLQLFGCLQGSLH